MQFLVLMDDDRYVGDQTNGRLSNALMLGVVVLAVGREVRVSVDATKTPAWRMEARLARWLSRISGGA